MTERLFHSATNREFRLRNSRAKRVRFNDAFHLALVRIPPGGFCVIGNDVSYNTKNEPRPCFPPRLMYPFHPFPISFPSCRFRLSRPIPFPRTLTSPDDAPLYVHDFIIPHRLHRLGNAVNQIEVLNAADNQRDSGQNHQCRRPLKWIH